MSSPAVPLAGRLVDSRGNPISSQRASPSFYGSNHLIRAATQTNERKRIADLDKDPHRNVSNVGRRTLMTLGRWLWSNFPVISGALDEMASLASDQLIPHFYGKDKAWGDRAEKLLLEDDKICDVAGGPYDMMENRRSLIISSIRDGDRGMVFVDEGSGYPRFQVIDAHRIQSPENFSGQQILKGGPYDGARIIDGVVVDDIGRPLAYRVVSGWDGTGETYISSRDFHISFEPDYNGQVRGFSKLGRIIFDMMDVQESREFELTAQKLNASISLIETNETGTADAAKQIMGEAPALNTDGTKAATRSEIIDGAMIRYMRAGTGSKLESHQADRPTQNQRDFEAGIIRAALHSLGWSVDFALDPTKIGGASMRVVVDKINRRLIHMKSRLIVPAVARYDRFRLSKFIKLGRLPENDEWYFWEYLHGKRLTADEKYQSDVNLQEVAAGNKTPQQAAAENGNYWLDNIADKSAYSRAVWAEAKKISEEFGISIQEAKADISMSQQRSSMSLSVASGPSQEPSRQASSEDEA